MSRSEQVLAAIDEGLVYGILDSNSTCSYRNVATGAVYTVTVIAMIRKGIVETTDYDDDPRTAAFTGSGRAFGKARRA